MYYNKIIILILGLAIPYTIISSEEFQQDNVKTKPTLTYRSEEASLESKNTVNSPNRYESIKTPCPPTPRKPRPVAREHIFVSKTVQRKLFFNSN